MVCGTVQQAGSNSFASGGINVSAVEQILTSSYAGLERVAEELMGRRKWRQYQQLFLSSLRPDDEASMETKDWQPSDQCNLCLDKGEILDASVLQRPPSECASVSSGCSGESASPAASSAPPSAAIVQPPPPPPPPHMTTLESVASSMAASLAAVAAIASGKAPAAGHPIYPPPNHAILFPHWYLPQPPLSVAPSPTSSSQPIPKSESPMVMAMPPSGSEQPLDLSKSSSAPSLVLPTSKSPEQPETPPSLQHLVPSLVPSPDSLRVPSLNRQIFKAKPRLSAVAGRRTYTEDELQAALRDIQSGKLGTRRAAVIYGIPRSTLRNKVYKLAMERERDSHLVLSSTPDLAVVTKARALLDVKDDDDILREDDDDDRDLSGAEEEREVEKALMKPLLSMEDLIRFSGDNPFQGTDSLRTLLQHGSKFMTEQKKEDGSSSPVFPVFPPGADVWSGMDHSALGPYISRLLSGNINALGHPNPFAMTAAAAAVTNRGSPPTERSPTDSPGGGGPADFVSKFPPSLELVRRMMEEKFIQEEQQRRDQRRFQLNGSRPGGEPGPSSAAAAAAAAALIKQETTSIDENSGSATPPNVILKIPSFKPTSKNGVPAVEPAPTSGIGYPLTVKAGESSQHSVISPPICSARSESSSPPSVMGKGINVTLRDVIAKSISSKFQQPPELHHMAVHTPPGLEHFRRAAEFPPPLGCNAPVIRNHNNNHLEDRKVQPPNSRPQASSAGSSNNMSTQGGKGTRPKRGKYRNYDRDSLVEAVRAVQRGEMSVHRAGSYYGVPHSTLEYKVKERHLMRPRKREPKPQPEEIKRKDEGNIVRMPPVDKCKPLPPPKTPKAPFTPPSPLPTGPNGLKIPPLFDPSLTYGAAPPFPFWHPSPFHHLPMPDYPRGPNFTPSPDQFFASQMIQRLQEDSARTSQDSSPPTLGQSARQLAEKLYDGTGTNGTFLDGIIRSSLETGLPAKSRESGGETTTPEHMSNKALLDQLCRNSRITPLPKPGGGAGSVQETSSSDEEASKMRGIAYNQNTNPSPVSMESIKEEPNEDDQQQHQQSTLVLSRQSSPHGDPTPRPDAVNGMEVSSNKDNDDDVDDDDDDNDVSACDSKQTMVTRAMDDVCLVAKDEIKET